jgi:stress response protein YsnF
MGEKQIAVDLQNVFRSGDYLYARGLTQADAKAMPEWTEQASVNDLDDDDTVTIEIRATRGAQNTMGYNPSQQK